MSKKSRYSHSSHSHSRTNAHKRRPSTKSPLVYTPARMVLDPAPIILSESTPDVYLAPVPEDPPPRGENLRLVLVLTFFVPGFGHWMMRSHHTLSYLLLTLLVWFLTLSALLALTFQGVAWLFLLVPLVYHYAAIHDAKVEYEGAEFKRWLHILF